MIKNCKSCKYEILHLKKIFSNHLNCNAFLSFKHHYSSLQCHVIFRNHNNVLIYCSRNISDYYQCWKQSCCTIILWKCWYVLYFRILWWIESSIEQHLFEIEIFPNIINVFTVTFDQFNASLLNKSITYIQTYSDIYNVRKDFYFYSILNFLFIKESWNIIHITISTKIWSSTTVFNIDNNQKCFLSSKSVYYYDFWRSCDTEDWSNDAENTALIAEINYSLTDIHLENTYFKLYNISIFFFTVFLIK